MAHELHGEDILWVAEDGSYGGGSLLTVNRADWTPEQNAWFDRHLDEVGGEPDLYVVLDIDKGIEPEWEYPTEEEEEEDEQ